MAVLDKERGVVVLRIAYDGPAMSGKTTTLRSLAGSLGTNLFSGDEAEGRTLYFDWLEYTGGRFDGHPIRCQVVSVPGQASLRSRRQRLLADADAIVFVVDSRRNELAACARMFTSLGEGLSRADPPQPGVVVQANKRDAADAVPLSEIESALSAASPSSAGCAYMESVASAGVGVREAFIFAVRLALDRVRHLMKAGALGEGPPEVESGESLLSAMRAEESSSTAPGSEVGFAASAFSDAMASELAGEDPAPFPEATAPTHVAHTSAAPVPTIAPMLPHDDIPGGMIWPPVGGRIHLHNATAALQTVDLHADGSAFASSGEWIAGSSAADRFDNADDARQSLLEWARAHAVATPRLSSRRCIVAAESGPNQWRLWQFVRQEKTVRRALAEILVDPSHDDAMRRLLDLAFAFADACESYLDHGIETSIDSLALAESGLVYVGFAPPRGFWSAAASVRPPRREADDVIRSEFAPGVSGETTSAVNVPRLLTALTGAARARGALRVGEILSRALIGQ